MQGRLFRRAVDIDSGCSMEPTQKKIPAVKNTVMDHCIGDTALEDTLRVLVSQKDHVVHFAQLADAGNVLCENVPGLLAQLRAFGCRISMEGAGACRLVALPDRLHPVCIRAGLHTRVVARHVDYHESLCSTNRTARDLAAAGAPEGTLVIAEHQSAGKGRMDRTWIAPPGSCILCSCVLYPPVPPPAVFQVTMAAGLAVARAIETVCSLPALIKWPNDVYVQGKKVCGILTEFLADLDRLTYAVVGVGINVNFDVARCPEIADTAVALSGVTGRRCDRLAILREFLQEFDAGYCRLGTDRGADFLRRQWQDYSLIQGKKVRILDGNEVTCGVAEDVTPEGHLILFDERSGRKKTIYCGDVSLRF